MNGQFTPVTPSYSEVIIGIRESHGVWAPVPGSAGLSHGLVRAAAALDHNEAAARAVPAGAREAQLRVHRGAIPRPADLVRDSRGPAGWRLTGLFAARTGKARLVRSGTRA
jgi:hypothetical protein